MDPNVLHRREGIQLRQASTMSSHHISNKTFSYNLPHRINDACVYPRAPSNGLTVILYAHDKGVRAVWYGGRRFKENSTPKVNGDSIDLTDANDDGAPEYEDEMDEIDPSSPYQSVLTYLDVVLGVSTTKIAVIPLPAELEDGLPQILSTHITVLVACADLSLRLIAIPLDPRRDFAGEIRQITISGENAHQDLISAVALTVTAISSEQQDSQQDRAASRSRTRDAADAKTVASGPQHWCLMLASTSATGTGILLIHQIPIDSSGRFSEDVEDRKPIQRRCLRIPLLTCRIAFNTSVYPSRRHLNLLVASADGSAVKVYQAAPQPHANRKRRGSAATTDSAISTSHTSKRATSDNKVLINLMLPYHQPSSQELYPRRKRVLDAQWILHGRAIMTLLDDGEWGIWDLDAAGPTNPTSANNLVKGQGNVSGIQGGSLTKFALRGSVVSGSATAKKSSTVGSSKLTANPSLAPMTPHTRKTRSEGLFQGQQAHGSEDIRSVHFAYGSLAVSVQPGETISQKSYDESVLINFESVNVLIPSIQAYWRSGANNRGVFDGAGTARPTILPQLQTAGEELRKVYLIPGDKAHASLGLFASTKLSRDFLAVTPSRLILFVAPLVEAATHTLGSSIPMRLLSDSSQGKDQMLLSSGELDVDGMDRILDSMANSRTLPTQDSTTSSNGFGRRSVGFLSDAHDQDEDTDMGTPTMPKSSKSKLIVDKGSSKQDGARRLFT